ncbi:AmpG family muropeptide MFS transporter [Zymomonas mobilis]|uniref:Major facilitator superfamily MFS_1 n=1 Tax=Zymomonas mobilis subsp. mobilis (strain ATCC 10988 / DSM 424 / LMG 404 / NCIMB 8938 / NRRL B-806 / ZM1) TaxID=555217 RepID=A0A0H3G2A4_ZYMMA|nr:MFS transporter [Zymomonas mobilis]AEH62938.1 major facilitator superfamily MFS_1 [Zymomonas mobilis subsp. mobilis ATCC 10988]TQL27452.1 PAT family beta-lactamase induction signal transducer AmpG [Zymomonas mobilis]TQL29395.1 PAT family beta-lactamase induction signal transducer AmpG [Zymomonas mobilis]
MKDWAQRIANTFMPYFEKASLAAFFLGIASGIPYTLLAATLTHRLSDAGIDKKSISAFALTLLMYSLKWLWAPLIDRCPIPFLTKMIGQRRAWLWVSGILTAFAIVMLGIADPYRNLEQVVFWAIFLGFCGATADITLDAYRIELLDPSRLGVGSGLSQYGWRIGSFLASSGVLLLADKWNWHIGYIACAPFVLIAPITSIFMGEPNQYREPEPLKTPSDMVAAFINPLRDFLQRQGAWMVLLFILLHKVGDTMANLMLRNLLVSLGFTKQEILLGDVNIGFFALLAGIFAGGILFVRMGMKRSVLLSLVLMAISNVSFAILAACGHSMPMLIFAVGFENFSSGIGGVTIVAYLSALCSLRFTATQFALLSALAGVLGRFLTGTTAGALIEAMGYVNYYILTTVIALPSILLYAFMMRSGMVDRSISETEGYQK